MAIYFYSNVGEYAVLSNFSRYGFQLDNRYWKTVEHYFQAQKFPGTKLEEKIRLSNTPKEAKRLGRSRSIKIRSDWENVKDEVMKKAVRRKFETNNDICALLINTGNEKLIENAPSDYYWGCGADGTGKNMLGRVLMEIRSLLRNKG